MHGIPSWWRKRSSSCGPTDRMRCPLVVALPGGQNSLLSYGLGMVGVEDLTGEGRLRAGVIQQQAGDPSTPCSGGR